jgi:hypothetical protein
MFSLSLSWRKTNAGSATSSPLTGWSARSYPSRVNRVDFAKSVTFSLAAKETIRQNGPTRGVGGGQLHLVRACNTIQFGSLPSDRGYRLSLSPISVAVFITS